MMFVKSPQYLGASTFSDNIDFKKKIEMRCKKQKKKWFIKKKLEMGCKKSEWFY